MTKPYSEWTKEELAHHKTRGAAWYQKNKEEVKARAIKYYSDNKEKVLDYQKDYYQDNKSKVDTRTRKYYKENVHKYLYRTARTRAKKFSTPFSIELEDIIVPEVCPVLGIKMERSNKRMNRSSPSVDKIDPKKGYTKGNIQVISLKANVMKNDATPEELRMFAKWVLKTFPEESDGKA